MKAILNSLFIMTLLIASSCDTPSSNKDESIVFIQGVHSVELNDLIRKNDRIQRDIAENIIMTAATTEHTDKLRSFLINSRRYLILLLENPKRENSLKFLDKAFQNIKKLPITIQDQSYINPYFTALEESIIFLYEFQGVRMDFTFLDFSFNAENDSELIRQKDDTAADFAPRSGGGLEYLGVNSFAQKLDGTTLIISPKIELGEAAYSLSFEYMTRFYPGNARAENLIRFYIGEDNEDINAINWELLPIEMAPDAGNFSDPADVSEPFNIDTNLKNIRIKVEYTSIKEKGFHPAFNLYGFKIMELE